MSTTVDVKAFLKKFGRDAGKSDFEKVMEAVASALEGFTSTYQLNQATQAKLQQGQLELQLKLQEAQRKQAADSALQEYRSNLVEISRQRLAQDQAQSEADQQLSQADLQLRQGREQRLTDQQNQDLEMRRLEEQGRQYRHDTPSGSTQLVQGAISDRLTQREDMRGADEFAQALLGSGAIGSLVDPDGAVNEENWAWYQAAREAGRLGIQAQQDFMSALHGYQLDKEAMNLNESLPAMRQGTIQALGGSKDIQQGIDRIAGQQGGRVSFGDIYGASPEQVLGAPGQIPPLFQDQQATPRPGHPMDALNRNPETGVPEVNMNTFNELMKLLNTRSRRKMVSPNPNTNLYAPTPANSPDNPAFK